MKEFLSHLFIPKESNNHRAKILHHTNLFLTIVFLLLTSFFARELKASFPSILGVSANISSEELLLLTNTKRQEKGVASLSFNEKLADAAERKAQDMFEYGYWAHNSPQGKTPWVFIKSSGYNYIYAGENLARGFSTTQDVIEAWMASPNHKANMLSSNYKDVGFAVKLGKLDGEETVLIVEEFGNLNIPIATDSKTQKIAAASETNTTVKTVTSVDKKPLVNSLSFASNIYVVVILIFIFVLLLDMIVIERKKVMRFVGHNIDHVFYLLFVLILVAVLSEGVII